jgi:Pyridine nucleotide-disulphide oxidoreductase
MSCIVGLREGSGAQGPAQRTTTWKRYNLVVIGVGSGGLTVAAIAAILGARVALLEKERMGGDCLHDGCVPSKALLKAAKLAYTVRTATDYGLTGTSPLPRQDVKRVMDYVRSVQACIAPHDSVEHFQSLGVDVFLAGGRLRSPHEQVGVAFDERFWYALNTARWGQTKGLMRSLFLLPTVQEEIQIILKLDPTFTPVYALAGHVLYEVPGLLGGDVKKAEEMFRKGLEQDP